MVPLTPSAWLGRVLLFSCLTLVVTVGGVVVVGRQWIGEALNPSSVSEGVGLADTGGGGGKGRVLAATDENPGVATELIFRIKTKFLALMQVSELEVTDSLAVAGNTVLGGDVLLSEGLTVEGDSEFAGSVAFVNTLSLSNGLNVTGGSIDADGIDVDLGAGTITASNIVYSLIAGDGIELAGTQEVTVTNADPGSAQKIFGIVKVGDVELSPGDNTDTLTLSAGSGVSLSTNEDDNEITVSAANQSGWYKPSDSLVALITNGNNVGLGLAAPTNKLEIDSGSTDTSGLTFTRLTSASTSGIGGGKVLSLDSGGRVILVNDQTGDTPTAESVLPDADSGSTLFFNGTNWVASTNLYHNGGTVGISTISPAARLHSYTNAVGTIGAIVQGITDQTANLQEWRNGAGSILSYIDSAGVFNGSANVAGTIDPGLVEGQVAFQGADGLAGSNNLFWDNSTGNLGVGTTAPSRKLHIVDNASLGGITLAGTSSPQFILTDTSDNQSFKIQVRNANETIQVGGTTSLAPLSLITNSQERLTIDTNGNVGVGTSSPTTKLQIYDTAGPTIYLTSDGATSGTYNQIIQLGEGVRRGDLQYITAGLYFKNYYNSDTANIYFQTKASGTPINAMTIAGSGNVGIGTTTPTTKLQVAGTIRAGFSGEAQLLDDDLILNSLYAVRNVSSDIQIGNSYATALSLYSGSDASATVRMRIASDGNVGIGTTAPSYPLHVYGTGNPQTLAIQDTTNDARLLMVSGRNNGILGGIEFNGIDSGSASQQYAQIQGGVGSATAGSEYGHIRFNATRLGTAGFEAMRVDGTGLLTLKGLYGETPTTLSFSADGANPIIKNTGGNGMIIESNDIFYRKTSNPTFFYVSGHSSYGYVNGRFGIGTTSPVGILTVEGAYTGKALAILNETGNQDLLVASASGVTKFKISNTGNIETGNTVTIGGATQTAGALYFFNNGVRIERTGNSGLSFTTGGSGVTGGSTFYGAAGGVPLSVQGATSQTGNLQEWKNSSATVLAAVNASGNIGIGTSTPDTHKLEVIGNSGIGAYYTDKASYAIRGIFQHGGNASGINNVGGLQIAVQPASQATLGSGNIKFFTAGANSAGATTDATLSERMTIQYDGKVGIGTTSPTQKLDVGGQFVVDTVNSKVGVGLTNPSSYSQKFIVNGTAWITGALGLPGGIISNGNLSVSPNGSIILAPSSTTAMTLLASGNVGIGSTTPSQKLDVVGNARFSAVGSDAYASDLHLTADGTLTTAASDIRLKKDLVELSDDAVLGKLLQLKTYNFNWKSNNASDIGMVAQEVATIFPELTFTNQVDGYMGINYSRFSSLLVSAMQAQQTQITSLQNKYTLTNTGTLQLTTLATAAAQPREEPTATEQPWYTKLAEAITVIKETIFSKAVRFEALAEFFGKAKFKDGAVVEGELATSANQTGSIEIPAGATKVAVQFTEDLSQVPSVILTPNGFIEGQYKVMDKTTNGFTIALSQKQSETVTFDWWASVKTEGQKQPTTQVLEQTEESTSQPESTEEKEVQEPAIAAPPVATQAGEIAGAESEATSSGETAAQ